MFRSGAAYNATALKLPLNAVANKKGVRISSPNASRGNQPRAYGRSSQSSALMHVHCFLHSSSLCFLFCDVIKLTDAPVVYIEDPTPAKKRSQQLVKDPLVSAHIRHRRNHRTEPQQLLPSNVSANTQPACSRTVAAANALRIEPICAPADVTRYSQRRNGRR